LSLVFGPWLTANMAPAKLPQPPIQYRAAGGGGRAAQEADDDDARAAGQRSRRHVARIERDDRCVDRHRGNERGQAGRDDEPRRCDEADECATAAPVPEFPAIDRLDRFQ
jgi:hypothetical protein